MSALKLRPANPLVGPMLTDLYQLTMAYAYWKAGKADQHAVFDLFFRHCPFGGEFAVFAGLGEALALLDSFRFTEEDTAYIRHLLPLAESRFFTWLKEVNCSQITMHAVREGEIVFARTPLLRVEGPLAVAQLLETGLLNCTNYATLVTTNAARFRLAAGPDAGLLEFGLRRAQGSDGGLSASRYAYMGGFDGTSNVLAGQLFGLPVRGTHAHAFVSSFSSLSECVGMKLLLRGGHCFANKTEGDWVDFRKLVLKNRKMLGFTGTNDGELAAFIAYAYAFPDSFLALVDTYDTLKSGVPNFLCVAMALAQCGYQPLGIRLDSGDLAVLSRAARTMFEKVWRTWSSSDDRFKELAIVASNDITVEVLEALNQQGHSINIFGIGTHLVTCSPQPALGAVYKLVEVDGKPKIKVSNQPEKTTLPGRKDVLRLYDGGMAIGDLLHLPGEKLRFGAGKPFSCCILAPGFPVQTFSATTFVRLDHKVWDGVLCDRLPALKQLQSRVMAGLRAILPDTLRRLNPAPYPVLLSPGLYTQYQRLLAAARR